MPFAEVVVNVPIRRTFSRRYDAPPPQPHSESMGDGDAFPNDQAASARLQTFHYAVPPELTEVLQPGHLVWAPFGARQVQGIVISLSERAPVTTKPIARLARPEPVLSMAQLTLASWIADYYVASLTEALKLFLPPGLLTKEGRAPAVRAKRELQIELLVSGEAAEARLESLARDTPQVRVLAFYLQNPGQHFSKKGLAASCRLKSTSAITTLQAKGVLSRGDDNGGEIGLAVDHATAGALLADQRGLARYRPIVETLAAAKRPLWKSELYERVDTNLDALRALQRIGVVALDERVRFRDPLAGRIYAPTSPPPLTSEQGAVWARIQDALLAAENGASAGSAGNAPKFLLHGVTGSGKTEIYLHAIAEVLARGSQAIVLVPEIALTPQTVARFAARFPNRVTVIHSGLSAGERYDVWTRVRDGEFDIVVGPRSALFVPFSRLGLIVIDEEHEASYKQNAEEWGSLTVFYDARTVALHMADHLGIPLIMGSATPSLESYFAAEQGRVELMEMSSRVLGHQPETDELQADGVQAGGSSAGETTRNADVAAESATAPTAAAVAYAEMPPVEVVDMRQELRAGNRSIFSRSLQAELHATIDAGEQAILFLNRRGTSTFIMCRDCGHVQECARCETPLTYHERVQTLICHRCNRRYPIPDICPECKSKRIKYFGSGTQRIEESVGQIEPRARLLRWDADTAARKGRHEEILDDFAQHRADVLIGTQMIAKGLDLPKVTLVGVIAADVGLFLPDFRSSERTFQLLTQVAGRAGRSFRGGRVVVQTYSPEHYAIQAAAQHDYAAFYARELDFRRQHGYPPVGRMARLIYWDRKLDKVQSESARMADVLAVQVRNMGLEGESVGVLGPAPAFFARYRGFYRWQILIRTPDPSALLRSIEFPFGWRIDIDPVSVL